jgi:hypothetical protein
MRTRFLALALGIAFLGLFVSMVGLVPLWSS